jgi:uncharacterized membrane protein YgcG
MAVLAGLSTPAWAQIISLERPPEGEFIVDKAGLINQDDAAHIREVCQRLLAEDKIPIIVATINAMGDHGGPDLRVETFATLLFDQWGIGREDKNLGILLLVSKQDRVSRIALGADWDRNADRAAQRIMNRDIIPHFKSGRFSQGIRAGVDALEVLARPREAEPQAAPSVTLKQTPAPQASPNMTLQQTPPQPVSFEKIPIQQNLPQHFARQQSFPVDRVFETRPRITHSSSSGFGGMGVMFAFVVIVGVVMTIVKGILGIGNSGGWGGGSFGSSRDDGFTSGFHLGSHFGGHHGGSIFGGGGIGGHHGGSSFGGGGHSGGGSSFGGGHSGGGGATGRW